MIYELSRNDFSFPNPNDANDDGLLAIGGDLNTQRILNAYKSGIFPWPYRDLPLLWFSPLKRALLYPKDLHVSKSLQKNIKRYEVRCDANFEEVIKNCAKTRDDGLGTWLRDDMIEAYIKLYDKGFAHSWETYFDGELIGGLYGLKFGKIFCGESMFSKKSDASKVALFYLCQDMIKIDGIIDCQIQNNHLKSLGTIEVTRTEYLKILKNSFTIETLIIY
ncbi:MAG: leucyl/phenylalanyl-tRNA--protein transferase [Campylobacteraceae bacterium]